MTVQYVVKYTYYRYNNGEGDNGLLSTEKVFDNYSEAMVFAKEADEATQGLVSWTWNFYDKFCDGWTGYVVSFDGLFVRVIHESRLPMP